MFPVRVLVESVRAQHCLSCAHDGHLLLDSYAVVSGHTLLSQLVDTVLSALGLSQLAVHSKGLVQINNWKALPFDQITDNPEDTVESLLKDISNHVTLKILTKQSSVDSPSAQCVADLKQRLLRCAVSRQPNLLTSIDNQQIRDLIQQVIVGDDPSMLNVDQMQAINDWLEHIESDDRRSPNGTARSGNASGGATTTRITASETPRLERWFKADANPSRQKLLQYMNSLNQSNFRRHHTKINYQQMCNWFANQRASQRPRPQPAHTNNTLSAILPTALSGPSLIVPAIATNGHSNGLNLNNNLNNLSNNNEMLRPKFDFNSLLDRTTLPQRIDGGSESPVPNDDGSIHSGSEVGDEQDSHLKQESTTSSPELSLCDPNGSMSSASPKPRPSPVGTNGTPGSAIGQASSTVARSRLMFDPLTELPLLEKWFEENPHPTWIQIDQYTDTLNGFAYRQSYPPISTHNVKIWFKNRRAKCKRMLGGDKM